MWMLSDPTNLNNVDFITSAMQLINVLVHSVEDVNYRVFLQQEFTNLGLDEFLKVCFYAFENGYFLKNHQKFKKFYEVNKAYFFIKSKYNGCF